MALRLVTSILSSRVGKVDPDCSKTKLTVRVQPWQYFPSRCVIGSKLKHKKAYIKHKCVLKDAFLIILGLNKVAYFPHQCMTKAVHPKSWSSRQEKKMKCKSWNSDSNYKMILISLKIFPRVLSDGEGRETQIAQRQNSPFKYTKYTENIFHLGAWLWWGWTDFGKYCRGFCRTVSFVFEQSGSPLIPHTGTYYTRHQAQRHV